MNAPPSSATPFSPGTPRSAQLSFSDQPAWIVADEVARGCAVVDVTHDLVAARDADHCVLLSRGAVVVQGAPRDVLTGERIAEVWGSGAGVGATMTG